MRIDVFTIFPEMVEGFVSQSLLGKARREGVLDIRVHDLRSAATDPHRSVDDAPFGGGAGMVLAPEPIFGAVELVNPPRPLSLLGPGGRRFDQSVAQELATLAGGGGAGGGGAGAGDGGEGGAGGGGADDGGEGGGAGGGDGGEGEGGEGEGSGGAGGRGGGGFSLLCGRYEGVDQRVVDHLVDGELSIGDYVLAGGEAASFVVIEAVARLVPGVMGNQASAEDESFSHGLLEYPQYTRPASFRGWDVPEVLLSGHHGKVEQWRRAAALARTVERRPDLIEARGGLSDEEVQLLERHGYPVPSPGNPEEPDAS